MSDDTTPVEGEVAANIEQPEPPQKPKKEKQPKGVLSGKDKRDLSMAVRTTETRVMNPVEYEQTRLLARDLIASEAVPACFANEQQVLMALRHGFELGLSPVQSLQSLYIVKGALKLWGSAVPRQLRLNGWSFVYKDESDQSCTVEVTNGEQTYSDTFTFAEAEASGYTKDSKGFLKVGWKLGINRKKKLRYGALGLIVSTYIPDALGLAVGLVEDDQNWQASVEDSERKNLADKTEDRKTKMRAAAAQHAELSDKNFVPKAVENAGEGDDDKPEN